MKRNTLSTGRLYVQLLLCAVLAACTSAPKIQSLADKDADFSQYRSFGFAPKLTPKDEGEYMTLATKYLKAAVRNEMESRGYTYSDTPDLWVAFNISTKEKVNVSSVPSSSVSYGYYGYRYGYSYRYGVWPDYSYETRVNQYTEGTLNVDVVDVTQKQLIWEGVAVGRMSEKMPDDLEAKANEVIAAIFAKYPIPKVGE